MLELFATNCPQTGELCTYRLDLVETARVCDEVATETDCLSEPNSDPPTDDVVLWSGVNQLSALIKDTAIYEIDKSVSCDDSCDVAQTTQKLATMRSEVAGLLSECTGYLQFIADFTIKEE